MQPGATVYKGYVYSGLANPSNPYYIMNGVMTDVAVGGKAMVSIGTSLVTEDGWHATEEAAKYAVRKELLAIVQKLTVVIDELYAMPAASEVAA